MKRSQSHISYRWEINWNAQPPSLEWQSWEKMIWPNGRAENLHKGKAAHPAFKKTFIGKGKWEQQKSSWTQSFKKQNREGRKVRAGVQKHQNAQLLLSKVAGRCLELLPSWRQGWAVEAHSPSSTSFPPSEFSSRAPISTPKEILKLWQSQNQSKGNRKWNTQLLIRFYSFVSNFETYFLVIKGEFSFKIRENHLLGVRGSNGI